MAKEDSAKVVKATTPVKKENTVNLVEEHVKRKMLNMDRNGMTGSRVEMHKESLNKLLMKGAK